MLVDRYEPEAIFARVPQAASRRDPVLKALDRCVRMIKSISKCVRCDGCL
jgi:hypothetical protein